MAKKPTIYHYVIMRNDIDSLSSGKASAHANHAGTQMIYWIQKHGNKNQKALLKQWWEEAEGAGTTIVLHANDEQMKIAISRAQAAGFAAGVWRDPTFPSTTNKGYFLVPMDVCGWMLGNKEELSEFLREFPLMP